MNTLAALLAALAVMAPAAPELSSTTFKMPSRNVYCGYYFATLRCDILSGLRPEPRRACEVDWTGLAIRRTGRPGPVCAGDTVADLRAPTLLYGRTWRRGGITCVSRTSGLRCVNADLRGFVLARERWRVF